MANERKHNLAAGEPQPGADMLSRDMYRRMVRKIKEYAIFFIRPNGPDSPAGLIASWNPGVERILGYSEEEFVGQPGTIIFTPEDRATGVPELELRVAAEQGEAGDDRWHLRNDGSLVWVNGAVTSVREPDGMLAGFVKVMRDNTAAKLADEALQRAHDEMERRVAERTRELASTNEQLRRSEARFVQAFQAAPFAAVIATRDEDRFLEVNEAFSELTGYSRQEALGRTAKDLGMWTSKEDQEKLMRTQKDSGEFRDVELEIRNRAGEVRAILVSGATIELEGEAGSLKLFYDVTERRRTEEELMQAIQDAMQDTAWFARSVMERLVQIRSGGEVKSSEVDLTPRERQVLERLARGMSNDQIGAELGIASQTVRNYIVTLYQKIGVHTRAEAVVWARERGLGV